MKLLERSLKALVLTRDYVGPKLLPAKEGWEWFDAGNALCKEMPESRWTREFLMRTWQCPNCGGQIVGISTRRHAFL